MWICYNAHMKHILVLCLFVPLFASAQTFSLNADWRFRKAPVTIPLAQAKSGIVCGELTALIGYIPGVRVKVNDKTRVIEFSVR